MSYNGLSLVEKEVLGDNKYQRLSGQCRPQLRLRGKTNAYKVFDGRIAPAKYLNAILDAC